MEPDDAKTKHVDGETPLCKSPEMGIGSLIMSSLKISMYALGINVSVFISHVKLLASISF